MRRNLCAVVTTWPFLVSLLALVVNDAWLKRAWPGLLSGKLSDFAGIAVVGLLLLTALPDRRRLVCGGIAAGFLWWKSPWSQPAIDAANALLPLPIGRTVDYVDLVALLVLPVCVAVASNAAAFALPGRAFRRLLVAPIVALTVFGLMATSVIPLRQDYQVRAMDRAPDLDREAVAQTIAQVAAQHGLQCDDCAARTNSARFSGNRLQLRYVFLGPRSISFEMEALPNGLFFGASGMEKADRLRNDLKSRLASLYKDLEYVEQLGSK